MYWVTPRHLAGDDDAIADHVGAAPSTVGWRMWPTARNTLLYVSPNKLCGAEWVRAACSFERGDLPVAWQISARSHPAGALPEWNAYMRVPSPWSEGRLTVIRPRLIGTEERADRSEAGGGRPKTSGRFRAGRSAKVPPGRLQPDRTSHPRPSP